MTKITTILSCVFAMAALFTACSEDDEKTIDRSLHQVTAKVSDGTQFLSFATSGSDFFLSGTYVASAADENSNNILFEFPSFKTGSYNVTDSGVILKYLKEFKTTYVGQTGTIQVTDFNTTDSTHTGTFSFVAVDSAGNELTISEGIFTDL